MNHPRNTARRLLFAAAVVLAFGQADALARKWTSASGQFSIEAEFVEVRDGKVVLKKENGKQITVPLDKLSDADRRYIASLNAKSPSGSAPTKAAPAAGKQAAARPKRQFKWETTERLLLSAEEAAKAKDGKIWVNNDGRHVAYVRKQGQKECIVVDGDCGKAYDVVQTCNFLKDVVFFGGGAHNAYIARAGDLEYLVVDGREDRPYAYINRRYSHLGQLATTWSYVATTKESPVKTIKVRDGTAVHDVDPFGFALFLEDHALWIEIDSQSSYYAVFDLIFRRSCRGFRRGFPGLE